MLGSCESPTAPARDNSPVQTDLSVYTLERYTSAWLATAIATYVNRTGQPVYYARCSSTDRGPMWGLRRTGPDSTRNFFTSYAWGCVGAVPTGEIKPGDSVSVRVTLGSLDELNMNPPLKAEDIIGTLRVFLELCAGYPTDSDNCVLLPESLRQSNAFLVRY